MEYDFEMSRTPVFRSSVGYNCNVHLHIVNFPLLLNDRYPLISSPRYELECNPIELTIPLFQLPAEGSMVMKSKYGQDYSCILPVIETREKKDVELEAILNNLADKFNRTDCVLRVCAIM